MDILKKNLSFIEKQNKSLYNKITSLNAITKVFDVNTNLAGQYNLIIDGKPVHSITDIDEECQSIVNSLEHDLNVSLHFLFGIGLGYLADKFVERTKGKVIVYESDIETLYFVLSAVDFSDNFQKGRLYFISDYAEAISILEDLFRYKSQVSLSTLDYYKLYRRDEFEAFKNFFIRRVELTNHNISFQAKTNYSFFKKTLLNLHKKFDYPLMSDYKDAFKDKPAIIVSAGPSLNKNIETIKKYQDKALIFCVGTAYKTLDNNGILPDFLHVIERRNTLVHYDIPSLSRVNLVVEPYTDSSYFSRDFKRLIYTTSLETDDARWFLDLSGRELIPYETKGTVAYHAIYTAYFLGCNPIILVGQDLAYTDGECYAKGSCFDGLACEYDSASDNYRIVLKDEMKFREAYFKAYPNTTQERREAVINDRLNELNSNLRTVEGQNGQKMPTDAVYELFLDYIQDFASVHSGERILLNASCGGALIKGFNTISLDEIFEKYEFSSLDKFSLIDNANFDKSTDIKLIYTNLKKDFSCLKSVISKLSKGAEISQELEKELSLHSVVTSKAAEISKQLSVLYADTINNYFLKNRLIKMVLFKEFLEMDYLMREYKKVLDYDTAKMYSVAYVEYFKTGEKKANDVASIIELSLKEMEVNNESCIAKS